MVMHIEAINATKQINKNKMKVLSKTEFNRAVTESLFNSGGTLACLPKTRFDMGKYQKTILGREIPEHHAKNVRIVWAEARSDKDGPYYALYCISNHNCNQ